MREENNFSTAHLLIPALTYPSIPHHTQVVAKFPPTLWLSEENLQSKLNFPSESLNLDGSELRSIIVSYPQILGLSLRNNLRHKMDFFLDASVQVIDPATLLLPKVSNVIDWPVAVGRSPAQQETQQDDLRVDMV